MERGEKRALLIAGGGHVLLFLALSLGIVSTTRKLPPVEDAVAVDLVDIAAVPSAPRPIPRTAPAQGPDETPDLPPEPLPPEPAPPEPKPELTPPAPAPKPQPAPAPKPKPAPEKPAPEKPVKAPDKTAPAKTAAPSKSTKTAAQAAPQKSRLGKDWLASVVGDVKQNAAPAQISAQVAAGLAQAIRAQVQPCWNPPAGGADVSKLVTVLRINFRKDGSVVGQPQVAGQTGVTGGNQAYARQHAEAAKRAVLRCQPLQLPADLYDYWKDIEFNFDARLND